MTRMRNQRGQALAETGIVIVIFMVLIGGVMQFGHAFMVANMVTHAARDGARLAASWQTRGGCGQLSGVGAIQAQVASEIATVSAVTFIVTVGQLPAVAPLVPPCTVPAIPTVTVNVSGCVPYIFNIPGIGDPGCTGGFLVNRTVTFDDELRGAFG